MNKFKKVTTKPYSLFILLAILLLVGCGDNQANAKSEKVIACDILGNNYMKNRYPSSEEIKSTPRNTSSSSQCSYYFKADGMKYYVKIEVYAGNDEQELKRSIRNRGDSGTPLSGIGKLAYQDIQLGQVNVWDGQHVFQVNASDGKKYNIEMAIEIARDVLNKIK